VTAVSGLLETLALAVCVLAVVAGGAALAFGRRSGHVGASSFAGRLIAGGVAAALVIGAAPAVVGWSLRLVVPHGPGDPPVEAPGPCDAEFDRFLDDPDRVSHERWAICLDREVCDRRYGSPSGASVEERAERAAARRADPVCRAVDL
jgi:hypothetical protein